MKPDLYESVKPIIDFNLSIKEKILEICRPLFDNFDVTYFEYIQILNNGTVFYISTNKEWLEYSLNNKMFDDDEHVRLCSIARAENYRYVVWDTLKLENTKLLSNYFHHDIWNGLTINEDEKESFNIYSFATTKSNTNLNKFFVNNFHLFDHFIFYFKQRLEQVLKMQPKCSILNATPLHDMNTLLKMDNYQSKVGDFLNQTKLPQFKIKTDNKIISVSNRELQCLRLLSLGKTSKEIGNQLEISHRTVESYISTVKIKTGLFFKNELLNFFEKSPARLYLHEQHKNFEK